VSVRDAKAWMPSDMLEADKTYFLGLHPNDAHAAAAAAWEAWAATLDADGRMQRVQTGAQTVWYEKGTSAASAAMDRAAWHRTRAKISSVPVGPKYVYSDVGEHDEYEVEWVDENGNTHKAIPVQEIRHWWQP